MNRETMLRDFLATFFADHYKGNSATAMRTYRNAIDSLEKFLGRPAEFTDFEDRTINLYIAHLLARGLDPETVKGYRMSILCLCLWRSAFLDHALVPKAPGRIRKLKIPFKPPRCWSVDELIKLITMAGSLVGVMWRDALRNCESWQRDGLSGPPHAGLEGEAEKIKYASAHDLRRSFGERWSPRIMPQVLKELMRHESIETTLKYYVGRNAQTMADVLWAAYESKTNSAPNSRQKPVVGTAHEKAITHC